jgi:hypothetical protein
VTEGRLSVEELEERLQSAYTARTRRELELLVADVSVHSIMHGRAVAPPRFSGSLAVREGPGFRTGTVVGLGCAAGHGWSRRDGRVPPARDSAFAASVESRLARCERRVGRWCLRRLAAYFAL